MSEQKLRELLDEMPGYVLAAAYGAGVDERKATAMRNTLRTMIDAALSDHATTEGE